MRIAVLDGQGGGIGRLIVEKLRQEYKEKSTFWVQEPCPSYVSDAQSWSQ